MKNLSILFTAAFFAFALTSCTDPYDMNEFGAVIDQHEIAQGEHETSPENNTSDELVAPADQSIISANSSVGATVHYSSQVNTDAYGDVIICFVSDSVFQTAVGIHPTSFEIRVDDCFAGKKNYTLVEQGTFSSDRYETGLYRVEWMNAAGKVLHTGTQKSCYCNGASMYLKITYVPTGHSVSVEIATAMCGADQ